MSNNEEVEWELDPARHWSTAYPYIEARAKVILEWLLPGDRMLTRELVHCIYPGSSAPVRDRAFKALQAAATRGLSQYVTQGEPETIGSVEGARRLWWHRPAAKAEPTKPKCPKCKREL